MCFHDDNAEGTSERDLGGDGVSLSLSLVLKLTQGRAGHSPAATPAAARRHSGTRISVHSPETGQDTRASGPCIASGGPAGVAHFGGREGPAARAVWARRGVSTYPCVHPEAG